MHRTIKCLFDSLEPEMGKPLQELIPEGEEIIYCSRTNWFMLYIQIITSTQVVIAKALYHKGTMSFAKPSIDMPKFYSIPLSQIVDVKEGKHEEYDVYYVRFYRQENDYLETCFMTNKDAQDFLNELKKVQEYNNLNIQLENRPPNRLRELTKLYNEGIITENEFQQKRKDILDQL